MVAWLAVACAVVTAAALGTGALTPADLQAVLGRLAPILGFVVAMSLVAELASAAGVFDVLARVMARLGRGRTVALWLLVVGLATVTTVVLSLDTTAVLLTPVVVVVARACGLSPTAFAIATVWLANTGSLLLPVSNLSNLLARQQLELSTGAFVALTWAPALVGVVVPTAVLAVVFRRALAGRYREPEPHAPADPTLLRVAGVVLVVLVPALVSGVPVWLPASVAAAVLATVFAVRDRSALRSQLVPAVPVLLTLTLFVLVSALHAVGLTELLARLAGQGEGLTDLLRLTGVVALAANLVNNLPAYLAFEPVAGTPLRLVATLIGTNLGAVLTPTASLATLLWFDRMRAMGIRIGAGGFALLGLVMVVPTLALATLTLWLVA